MVFMIIKGGLGNQIFQLFAGKVFSIMNESQLGLLLDNGGKGAFQHGESILGLDISFEYEYEITSGTGGMIKRMQGSILRRFPDFYNQYNKYFTYYLSQETGYDNRAEQITGRKIVEGYFQSHKYFDYLRQEIPNLMIVKPKNASLAFNELADEMVEQNPIVLHIRRGDYVGNKSVGLLSENYYIDAIRNLETTGRPLWIFSDDCKQARNEMRALDSFRSKWISSTELNRPSENLCLMSMAQDIVIANSTFSYWAAMLNNQKNVIAPSRWSLGSANPKDLYPPQWKSITSKFTN
jgi:hypothetical protein